MGHWTWRRHARLGVSAVALGLLGTMAPIGWPSAAGASPTFSYQSIRATEVHPGIDLRVYPAAAGRLLAAARR